MGAGALVGGDHQWPADPTGPRLAVWLARVVRALTWADVDRDAGTITVSRSMLPDGTVKATKTAARARVVPMLPGTTTGARDLEDAHPAYPCRRSRHWYR
jgi:hypothetical protein